MQGKGKVFLMESRKIKRKRPDNDLVLIKFRKYLEARRDALKKALVA